MVTGNRYRGRWAPLLLGAGLFLGWLLLLKGRGLPSSVTAVSQPIIATDLNQQRADTVLPLPQGGLTIQQTFVPRWDGLREIELVLARPGEKKDEGGRFTLKLFDDADNLIAEQELATATLTHNQTYTLRFPPQRRAAGRRYTLQFSGSADNPVSVWGYSLDVVGRGELVVNGGALATAVPATTAQDLRLVARTQLTWADAFISLGTMLWKDGPIMLLALFFLPMPGALLLLAAENFNRKERQERRGIVKNLRLNPLVWWGAALALGTAVWPLLWLGLTLLGGRWRGWSLWLLFTLGWLVILFLWRSDKARDNAAPPRSRFSALPFLLLLLLILATRLLAVRDLSFPPWVDASRHGLITAVMTHSGQLPGSYEPYLPVSDAPYHYGFHTLSAGLALMTGWPLNRLLLFLGQLINGLIPLTVYTAVILMTRRQRAGLLAAFLVGLPFFLPGYYVTWGRLTQLTAMLVMPILLALTWLLVRGSLAWRRAWWLVALLAAGLFLIHLRVFLFFLPFVAIVWLVSWGRNGRYLSLASGAALILVSPRLWQLLLAANPTQLTGNPIPNYNDFPINYVQTGWEQQYWQLAGIALLPVLVAGLRRRSWSWLPLILTGWGASLVILLAGERVGLPSLALANLNSLYITLFLPLAIFLGVAGDQFWRWLRRQNHRLQWPIQIIIGGVLTAVFLFGVRQQISILNPQTLLAQRADVAGLEWAARNVPETAVIAVSSWKWLGETWAASDGGAWIVPLTGRAATTPPIDHIYNSDLFQFVRHFNETATAVADWSDPIQADWLRAQGVTHIFIGARGGFFDPAVLARNPQMEMAYGRDGVFVFKIND